MCTYNCHLVCYFLYLRTVTWTLRQLYDASYVLFAIRNSNYSGIVFYYYSCNLLYDALCMSSVLAQQQ
jgi:hypothetical protein